MHVLLAAQPQSLALEVFFNVILSFSFQAVTFLCCSFFSFCLQPSCQTSFSLFLFLMKARICWAAWRCGLASEFACLYPSSLSPCLSSWQCSPTTPVPRLQKPRLQLLRECQPAQAFPLVGRTHCHTATLSLLAKFLSCFALSSFFLFFPPKFSHSASFMALFSAGNLFVSSHCTLVQVFSMVFFFPSSFLLFWLIFELNFLLFHATVYKHSLTVNNMDLIVATVWDPGHVCYYLHVLACHRQ